MKIRLEGTPTECEQAAALLGHVLDVVSVSDPRSPLTTCPLQRQRCAKPQVPQVGKRQSCNILD
jgi:hypothetical protein